MTKILCRRNSRFRARHLFTLPLILAAGILLLAPVVSAQTRDFLTEQEAELVRFHQELDGRIEVFIKAIDRRFAIINGTAQPKSKKSSSDEPEWGEVPKGTRAQLLDDIAGILDAAIENIDDVSRKDERNPLISRSLRRLTNATQGYLNQLSALRDKVKDADEIATVERVADQANQIIEAGSKLAPPSADEDKKKKKKP